LWRRSVLRRPARCFSPESISLWRPPGQASSGPAGLAVIYLCAIPVILNIVAMPATAR
jgi:hypothetical protein